MSIYRGPNKMKLVPIQEELTGYEVPSKVTFAPKEVYQAQMIWLAGWAGGTAFINTPGDDEDKIVIQARDTSSAQLRARAGDFLVRNSSGAVRIVTKHELDGAWKVENA